MPRKTANTLSREAPTGALAQGGAEGGTLGAALLLWTALAVPAYHVVIDYAALGIWRESNEFRVLEYVPVYRMLLAGSGTVRSRVLNFLGRLRGFRSWFARRRRR